MAVGFAAAVVAAAATRATTARLLFDFGFQISNSKSQISNFRSGFQLHVSSGGPLITWRTSIGIVPGVPSGAGAADARAAN